MRYPHEDGLDLRARAELALAYEAGEAPPQLFRHTRWLDRLSTRIGLALGVIAGIAVVAVLTMRPPALVRDAIEHEYYERTLRGNFIPAQPLLFHLGLHNTVTVPGYPQLMRPCEIDGKLAYHLTTFFEKGGLVTVFGFDKPVTLPESSGWWNDVYWQVVTSRDGQPLIMVSEKKRALTVARTVFAKQPA